MGARSDLPNVPVLKGLRQTSSMYGFRESSLEFRHWGLGMHSGCFRYLLEQLNEVERFRA